MAAVAEKPQVQQDSEVGRKRCFVGLTATHLQHRPEARAKVVRVVILQCVSRSFPQCGNWDGAYSLWTISRNNSQRKHLQEEDPYAVSSDSDDDERKPPPMIDLGINVNLSSKVEVYFTRFK